MRNLSHTLKASLHAYRGLLIPLIVIACIFVYQKISNPSVVSIPNFNVNSKAGNDEARVFWKSEIGRVGGISAYKEFLNHYASSSPQTQHTAAHIFGGSLFAQEGLSGLVACDSSYSFGCYHEFLGRAIEKNGLGGVNELNQACFDALGSQRLSCSHGLGHGIQSYLGYTDEALIKSLATCATLDYSDPIGGCFGGVFMEYNTRTMQSYSGMPSRGLQDGGVFHPCDIVPAERKAACYYWQPQWWSQIFATRETTPEEVFGRIGKLCRGLAPYLRQNCFSGAGTVVGISTDYDAERSSALCEIASPNANEQAYCKTSAASSFFGERSARDRAPSLCEKIEGVWHEKCVEGASGTSAPPQGMEEFNR